MELYLVFFIMAGLPLLGFLLALVWVSVTRRARALERSDWSQPVAAERRAEASRLVFILACSGAKVVYGVVQALLLAVTFGGLSGAPLPSSLGSVGLPVFCMACAGVNFVTALADGLLGAGEIRKGRLTSMEGFRSALIKLMLIEFLTVLCLLVSFLAILGYVPLKC